VKELLIARGVSIACVAMMQQLLALRVRLRDFINEKSGLSFNVKRRLKFSWQHRSIVRS
jgi:hypothetical protein